MLSCRFLVASSKRETFRQLLHICITRFHTSEALSDLKFSIMKHGMHERAMEDHLRSIGVSMVEAFDRSISFNIRNMSCHNDVRSSIYQLQHMIPNSRSNMKRVRILGLSTGAKSLPASGPPISTSRDSAVANRSRYCHNALVPFITYFP